MRKLIEKVSPEEHQKLKKALKNYKVEVDAKIADRTLTMGEHMTLCFMEALDGLLDKKFSKSKKEVK